MLSVIDTNTDKKLADIKIDGDTLEAMALDAYRPRLYVNDKAKNTVVVIDRETNAIVAPVAHHPRQDERHDGTR